MPENPAPSSEAGIWDPTRTDAVVLAVGVVFVGTGALVTLILPSTPGWTFLANFGLSAGVAIALIGVLLRFQLRIEAELNRLGEAIDEQAERTRRLEGQSVSPPRIRQDRPTQERRAEPPRVRRDEPVAHKPETTQTKARWSSFTDTLERWSKSAHRPYRPPKPRKTREPLFRLPQWLTSAVAMVLGAVGRLVLGLGWLTWVAVYVALVLGGLFLAFGMSWGLWGALLRAVGLSDVPVAYSEVAMMLAGLTTAILVGLGTWHLAELRLPVAIAASMTVLVALAVAQYGFGVFL